MAKRIQMTRHKPWRKDNPDAVIVSRPSTWENPYRVGIPYKGHRTANDQAHAVALFAELVEASPAFREAVRRELRGKDLACWCAASTPCHSDILLAVAREDEP